MTHGTTVHWRDARRPERGLTLSVHRGAGIYLREVRRGARLSVLEAAGALGIGLGRFYRMVRRGAVRTVRQHRKLTVPFAEVVRLRRGAV